MSKFDLTTPQIIAILTGHSRQYNEALRHYGSANLISHLGKGLDDHLDSYLWLTVILLLVMVANKQVTWGYSRPQHEALRILENRMDEIWRRFGEHMVVGLVQETLANADASGDLLTARGSCL